MFYAQSTSTVIMSGRSKVSNLMFYAQLTSMVISGLSKVGSMETETLKSGHGGENNEVTHCPIQMTVNLNLEARLKPVLNWANVCSPEHTSDTSTNYDSFLN